MDGSSTLVEFNEYHREYHPSIRLVISIDAEKYPSKDKYSVIEVFVLVFNSERSGWLEQRPVDESSLNIEIEAGTGSPEGDEAQPETSSFEDKRSTSLSSVIPGLSESPTKNARDLIDWWIPEVTITVK